MKRCRLKVGMYMSRYYSSLVGIYLSKGCQRIFMDLYLSYSDIYTL